MAIDYSQLTEEDLDRIIAGGELPSAGEPAPGQGLAAVQNRNKAAEALVASKVNPETDNTYGWPWYALAGAGVGKFADDLASGVSELGTMATLPTDPAAKEKIINQLNTERRDRERVGRELLSTTGGMAGNLGAEALVAAVAPARLPAQVATQGAMGFLRAPHRDTKGLTGELVNRAAGALEGAGTAAAVGVPVVGFGKLAGAMAKEFGPRGQQAMDLEGAAKRVGVPSSLRDLDPSSEIAGFEGALPGRAKFVESQEEAFRNAAKASKAVPSSTGRSTTDRVLEGEKVREAVTQSSDALRQQGSLKWNELDSYINQNQVAPVIPQRSYDQAQRILNQYTPTNKAGALDVGNNPILARIDYYDPQAAQTLAQMAQAPKTAVQYGAPFSNLHEIQSAVGKALGKARKDASAPGAGHDTRQAVRELETMYASISNDVDNWLATTAKKSGNTELTELANGAKDFWRDVVVPGTSGRLVAKSKKGPWRQNPQAYAEPSQFYSDLAKSKTQIEELMGYMTPEQQDLVRVFNEFPDLQSVLRSGTPHPAASGAGMLTNVGGMMLGSPLQLVKGVMAHTPIVKDVMSHPASKQLYFAKNLAENSPLGRVGYGVAQRPRRDIRDWERRVLGRSAPNP